MLVAMAIQPVLETLAVTVIQPVLGPPDHTLIQVLQPMPAVMVMQPAPARQDTTVILVAQLLLDIIITLSMVIGDLLPVQLEIMDGQGIIFQLTHWILVPTVRLMERDLTLIPSLQTLLVITHIQSLSLALETIPTLFLSLALETIPTLFLSLSLQTTRTLSLSSPPQTMLTLLQLNQPELVMRETYNHTSQFICGKGQLK